MLVLTPVRVSTTACKRRIAVAVSMPMPMTMTVICRAAGGPAVSMA
jgi:hypothetical protein